MKVYIVKYLVGVAHVLRLYLDWQMADELPSSHLSIRTRSAEHHPDAPEDARGKKPQVMV